MNVMSIFKLRRKGCDKLGYQLFCNSFYVKPCSLPMPAAAERRGDNTDIDGIEGAEANAAMRFGILPDNTNRFYSCDALDKLICHIGISIFNADFQLILICFIRNDESSVIIRLHTG